ncbi:hypothetical protein COLO4_24803 [Corchorus olitorius]|uniref:Uncharacterized protein n=1 Tax=Corchorus olitorius TaxID=93759 RepID=A0A1R3I6T0_9ROSI|nr:hypothetical protein COLO4_24803 [Corchorus olitorius]
MLSWHIELASFPRIASDDMLLRYVEKDDKWDADMWGIGECKMTLFVGI